MPHLLFRAFVAGIHVLTFIVLSTLSLMLELTLKPRVVEQKLLDQ